MNRLSWVVLLFSLIFTALIILPGLPSAQFGPFSLMKNGDVLDLATPLILIPLYWLMFQLAPGQLPRQGQMLLFMLLAALWAAGQGMHLSANFHRPPVRRRQRCLQAGLLLRRGSQSLYVA
jgi:hypothetical protein